MRYSIALVALGLLGAQPAAQAAASNKELEAQAAVIESRLGALEQRGIPMRILARDTRRVIVSRR